MGAKGQKGGRPLGKLESPGLSPRVGEGCFAGAPRGKGECFSCCFPLASRAPTPPSMFTVRTLYSCTWVRTVPGYLGSAVLTVGADLMDLPRSIMHAA